MECKGAPKLRALTRGSPLGKTQQQLLKSQALGKSYLPRGQIDDQFVLERDDFFVGARIALPGRTPEELPIDAAGLVALRGDNVETSRRKRPRLDADIRPPPSHVGGYRDNAGATCAGNNFGFMGIMPSIEQRVDNALPRQLLRELLRIRDCSGPYEHGL
jgi:hypothetical protein